MGKRYSGAKPGTRAWGVLCRPAQTRPTREICPVLHRRQGALPSMGASQVKDMNEFISRRPEWQPSETARPAWPPGDTISRVREQGTASDHKPEGREYQMGEPIKTEQHG